MSGTRIALAALAATWSLGCDSLLGYDDLKFYDDDQGKGGSKGVIGAGGASGSGAAGAGGGAAAGAGGWAGSSGEGGGAAAGAGGGGGAGGGTGGGTGASGGAGGNGGNGAAGGAAGGSGGGGAGGGSGGGGAAGGGAGGGGPVTTPLAADLTIARINVNQGVSVDVMQGGAPATSKAPVVAGRDGVMRVFVSPGAGWQARNIVGVLAVESGSAPPAQVTATQFVSGPSNDGSLPSTINFDLPAGSITPDAKYSVELHEEQPNAPPGSTSGARWPSAGTTPLGAQSANGDLQVVLVPMQYNADGSGRLPDTSPGQIDAYHKRFRAMYPAPDVKITVRAPMSYSGGISAGGGGWGNALNALCSLRQGDGASSKVYYHGIFAPASSMGAFCGGGCVAGLCNLGQSPNDSWARCCVGLGYSGEMSADTAVHEVGHAHGRNHAPCGGAQGTDPYFPYPGGGIGVWGYDIGTKALKSPSGYKDIMGYCSPGWVSDHNYKAWFDRIAYVNAKPLISWPASMAPRMRAVLVEPDGSLAWSVPVELRAPPGGTPVDVAQMGAGGAVLSTATGWLYPFDHLPGGTILVPEPDSAKVKSVAIAGFGTLKVAP